MDKIMNNQKQSMSIGLFLARVFIPTTSLTLAYYFIGYHWNKIPSLLLFFCLALLILVPAQLAMILISSKRDIGRYSLHSAFSNHQKMKWWKIFLYAFLLFGLAGILSVTITPLEAKIFAPLAEPFMQTLPAYFDWQYFDYIRQYPDSILIWTCVTYLLVNVFIAPIVEELFFRGYLTAKLSRFGSYTPLIVTVIFSLYHFWLPFNNLFRILAFYPAALVAWRMKNIYISIVFHVLCNLTSAIGIIVALYPY